MTGMPTMNLSQVQIIAEGLDHPEAVTVDAQGTLWAGGEAGQIYRIDPETGTVQEVTSTGGFVLGVTVDGNGHLYACDSGRRALLRVTVATGKVETLVTSVSGRPLVNPNYAVFDRDGRLYVSDSGHFHNDDGFLFALDPDGTARIVHEQLHRFPNGLALDAERGELYIVESTLPGITKLRLADGYIETVVELPGMVPDGVALDENRAIYCGCYRPDTILCISDGKIEVLLTDPEGTMIAAPTNLAFGGPDRRSLYIASLGRWHLGMIRLAAPGLPLCYPARP